MKIVPAQPNPNLVKLSQIHKGSFFKLNGMHYVRVGFNMRDGKNPIGFTPDADLERGLAVVCLDLDMVDALDGKTLVEPIQMEARVV